MDEFEEEVTWENAKKERFNLAGRHCQSKEYS
jgi:hypothetical protein